MYNKTQRTYTEKATGKRFPMYQHSENHSLLLVNDEDGEEVKAFFCCAHTACTVKFNDGSTEDLQPGEFVRTETRKPTHRRFFIQKRFTAI